MRPLFTRLIYIILFFCPLSIFGQDKGKILSGLEINSAILHGKVKYSVYLPPNYDIKKSRSYNVFYLLHGYGGDHSSWIKRSKVNDLLDSLHAIGLKEQYIVVMPSARNSYYINDYKNNFAYEDFFIDEFMPKIDSIFKPDTVNKPIIGGLSMGGFGAIILSVKHPDVFSTSISLSAAVRTPEIFMNLPYKKYNYNFSKIYGDSLIGKDRITEHWKQNSPFFIIDSVYADTLNSISWYVECGMEDFLFPANEAFHQLLVEHGISHNYHIRPGVHSWEFWKDGLINALWYVDKLTHEK